MHKDLLEEHGLRSALNALAQGRPEAAASALRDADGDVAGECVSLLRDGLQEEAALRLKRWLSPKFSSVGASREAYAKAMGGRL